MEEMSQTHHTSDVLKHLKRIDERHRVARISKLRASMTAAVNGARDEAAAIAARAGKSMRRAEIAGRREKFSRTDAMSLAIRAELSAARDISAVKEEAQRKRVRAKVLTQRQLRQSASAPPSSFLGAGTAAAQRKQLPNRVGESMLRRKRGGLGGVGGTRLDPKVLAAMDAKEMVSAEDDEAWTSLARRVLQDANDLAVWGWTPPQGASTDFTPSPFGGLGAGSGAGGCCLPARLRKMLPLLWDKLGKLPEEREASCRTMNEALRPELRVLTNAAYEISLSSDAATGRLSPRDRALLDRQLAAAARRVHMSYVAREEAEARHMHHEIGRLYQEIARTKRVEKEQQQQQQEEAEAEDAARGEVGPSSASPLPLSSHSQPLSAYRVASQQQAMVLLSQPTVASGGKMTEEQQRRQRDQLSKVVAAQARAAAKALRHSLLARRRETGGRDDVPIPAGREAKLKEAEARAWAEMDWLRSMEHQIDATSTVVGGAERGGVGALRERALVRHARAMLLQEEQLHQMQGGAHTESLSQPSPQEATRSSPHSHGPQEPEPSRRGVQFQQPQPQPYRPITIDPRVPLMDTIESLTDELSQRKSRIRQQQQQNTTQEQQQRSSSRRKFAP